MHQRYLIPVLAVTAALSACSHMGPGNSSTGSVAAKTADTAVVLLPDLGSGPMPASGCWATFFDERDFKGSSLTLVGPVELQTLDKGTAKQLKRDIQSVATGSSATLILYERQFLSARSVGFTPSSRESELISKLGFGGRVESISLHCK